MVQQLRPETSRPCSRTRREVMAKQPPPDSYFPVLTVSKYLPLESQGSDSIKPGTILPPAPTPTHSPTQLPVALVIQFHGDILEAGGWVLFFQFHCAP